MPSAASLWVTPKTPALLLLLPKTPTAVSLVASTPLAPFVPVALTAGVSSALLTKLSGSS
jgi:hypothetical protein